MEGRKTTDKPFGRALRELMDERGIGYPTLERDTKLRSPILTKEGKRKGLSRTFLNDLVKENNPVNKEQIEIIAAALKISPDFFKEYRQFEAKEVIDENIDLAEMLIGMSEFRMVPVVGAAPASSLEEAMHQELGYVPSVTDADFAVRVNGDCLIDAGVLDGDIVLLKDKPAKPGDIVLARLDGEVTLKQYFPQEDYTELRPANPNYKSIIVKGFEESKILGVKVGLFREG